MKFDELPLSKNCIPLPKTLFIDLSNIAFNYLCENWPYSLCHFWNHDYFFTTQFIYIISAQTLHAFDKNIPSKCEFSDFSLLKLKFIKQKGSFSLNFGSLFSLMITLLYFWFGKTDLWFRKWHEEYGSFTRALESLKIGILMGSFNPKQKKYELKSTGELCVMTMKNDAKFEEELTCHFKIDKRNLTNFDLSGRKTQRFLL